MLAKKSCRFTVLFFLLFCCIHTKALATIKWNYNFREALNTAKIQNKPIMVDFSTEGCGWCKKLDKDTYSHATIEKLAESFICVKIDAHKSRDLARQYKVNAYPTILFFNQQGILIDKNIGYKKPDDFAKILNAILTKITAYNPQIIQTSNRAKQTTNTDFTYNGYMQDEETIVAQINYSEKAYFLEKGNYFKGYKVTDITAENLILENGENKLIIGFRESIQIP